MAFTHLVVGLGNPEGKYFQTYHNVGFLAAENLAEKFKMPFKKKGNQMLAKVGKTLVLKPLTYMNLSGQAVLAVVRKHKIPIENVIVICDDLYIEKGNIRVSFGGSGGGHNGLKSITELLGTNKYIRIRIGIMPDTEPHSHAQYVLTKIGAVNKEAIDNAIEKAVVCALQLSSGISIETLQGKYNVKNTPH